MPRAAHSAWGSVRGVGYNRHMTHSQPDAAYMPGLHLVLGPPNAGKLGAALSWWAELRHARPLLVVPSLADATEVESELLRRVSVVLDDRPVCTFDRLVTLLAPEGPPLLGEVRRSLIVTQILEGGLSGPLGALADLPGTPEAVRTLIDEFGEGGHSSESVLAALRRGRVAAGESAAGGSALFADLALLVGRYAEAVAARGAVDRHQALTAAASTCADWGRPVAFHGFLSFTPAQRRLVLALSEHVPALVTLAFSLEREIAGHAAEEAEKLRKNASTVVHMSRQDLAFASPAIAHLERSFLVPSAEPLRADEETSQDPGRGIQHEGVRFLVSGGRRSEVESVSAEIIALLRGGARPDDIGVLLRDVGPWQRLVREVFTRFGVPHSIDGQVEFGATGLGHTLLRSLRGIATQDLDSLLAYVRTAYHPASASAVDDAEARLRRRAVTSGRHLASEFDGLLPGALDLLRDAVVWEDGEAVGLEAQRLVTLAAGMVATAAFCRPLGSPALSEDALALAALSRALREAAEESAVGVFPGERLGGASSRRSFDFGLSILQSLPVSLGVGDEVGVVQVTSIRRARARRFQVVFVLGLVDGEFPGPSQAPGLLGTRARRLLVDGGGRPLLSAGLSSDDAALFALSVSRAWQLLYLSARDAEDDGSEVLPSPFWAEARRLLGGGKELRRGLEDVVFTPADAPTPREFLRACAASGAVPADPREAERFERLPAWECRPIALTDPGVIESLSSREKFSATEIEAYVGCPYRWFADRVVGLNTMEESLGGLQAGSVVHRVLREVYERLLAEGAERLTPPQLEGVLALVPGAIEEASSEMGGTFDESEVRLLLSEVERRIRWFLKFDADSGSELSILALESSLRAEGVDMGGFRLTGRIDRVDVDPDSGAAIIVDYKYGSQAGGPDFAAKGILQVPLYMLALQASRPELAVSGGVYVALGGRQIGGAVFSAMVESVGEWSRRGLLVEEDRLEEELRLALAAASKAVAGIRAGEIKAEPLKECPRYCTLGPLCRVPSGVSTW